MINFDETQELEKSEMGTEDFASNSYSLSNVLSMLNPNEESQMYRMMPLTDEV